MLLLLPFIVIFIGPILTGLLLHALWVMPQRQREQIALLRSIDRSLQALPAVREMRAAQATRKNRTV